MANETPAPGADPVAMPPAPAVMVAMALFSEYLDRREAAEVRAYEARIGGLSIGTAATGGPAITGSGNSGHPRNVWDFVRDAVDGVGGFADGTYLYPFPLESEGEVPGRVSDKYRGRCLLADYDGFAGDVCQAPYDLIASKADMIKRELADPAAAEWVRDVDGNGLGILDFLEEPFRQARMHGVGVVVVDRPAVELRSKAEDLDPRNRPYLYCVPTKNVRRWWFDERGDLLAILWLENPEDASEGQEPAVRVWTRSAWAVFRPLKSAESANPSDWVLDEAAPHTLDRVPVVLVHNDRPERGVLGMGRSEMLKVSKIAQTVFNMDSEAREIERKAAAPIFTIPVKDAKGFADGGGTLVTGLDSALAYDGEAGAPAWVQPDLSVLEHFEKRRDSKIAAAYRMANLAALYGSTSAGGGAGSSVQTTSGFHSEVEFSKSERRVSRLAANLQAAEEACCRLFRAWLGTPWEDTAEGVEIDYPTEFGIRDLDRLLKRTQDELAMVQGEDGQRAILEAWFRARFPRKPEADLVAMLDAEMKKRASARAQLSAMAAKGQAAMGRMAGGPPAPGKGGDNAEA